MKNLLLKKKAKRTYAAIAMIIAAVSVFLVNIDQIITVVTKWLSKERGIEIISLSTDSDRSFLNLKESGNILKFEYNLEDKIINGFLIYNPDVNKSNLTCSYDPTLSKLIKDKWNYGLRKDEKGNCILRFGSQEGFEDCKKIINRVRSMPIEKGMQFHDPVFDIILENYKQNNYILKEIQVVILEIRHPITTGALEGEFDRTPVIKPAIEYQIDLPDLLKVIFDEFPKMCLHRGLIFPGAFNHCQDLVKKTKKKKDLGSWMRKDLEKFKSKEKSSIDLSTEGYPVLSKELNDKLVIEPMKPLRFQIRFPSKPDSPGTYIVLRFNFVFSDQFIIQSQRLCFWYDW